MFRSILRNGFAKSRQLDSLVGRLVHLAQTVYGARLAYRALLDLQKNPEPNKIIDDGFKANAWFWINSGWLLKCHTTRSSNIIFAQTHV